MTTTIRIRPFQTEDAEQVKELFWLGIAGSDPTSARYAGLRGNFTRPNSLMCYLMFSLGLFCALFFDAETQSYIRLGGTAVAALSVAFFFFHIWQLDGIFKMHGNPANHRDFDDIGRHYGIVTRDGGRSSEIPGRSGFWVAELVNAGTPTRIIVGCVGLDENFTPDPRVAELRRMAVSSSMQRRGIGKRLIEEALEHARTHKFQAVTLVTTAYQSSAVGIYQRFGWNAYGRSPVAGKPWLDFNLFKYRLDL